MSAAQKQITTRQPKKRGFLSRLVCCGAPAVEADATPKESEKRPVAPIQQPEKVAEEPPAESRPIEAASEVQDEPSPSEEAKALETDTPLVPASAAITATSATEVSDEPDAAVWLLPPLSTSLTGKKCLVLDLDETLVHSSFKVIALCIQANDRSSIKQISSCQLRLTVYSTTSTS